MKSVKIAILLVAWALSLTADGEVLVYKLTEKDINGFERDTGQWRTFKGNENGFLVFEVDLDANEILQTSVIWYWTDTNGVKWYEAYAIDGFELVAADVTVKHWVVLLKDTDIYMLLLTGKTISTSIGTSQPEDIARGLKGYSIYDETTGADREMGTTQLSVKLDAKKTKQSNDPGGINQDFDLSVDEVILHLEQKGYGYW